MKTKVIRKTSRAALAVLILIAALFIAAPAKAYADNSEAKELVTEYGDLWTGRISVKAGETVKWYVNVPDDVVPKGCGATVKIPGLGFGTDTHNKEEGHIVLTNGKNFIYEFTPEETGDILFTCWMGSGCHSNYIHVTEDGTYNVPVPNDPSEIKAVWDDDKLKVSFHAPDAPEGSTIVNYKATAQAEDGSKKKASGKESPIVFEGLDKTKSYTVSIVTIGSSGKSKGENSFTLNPASEAELVTIPEGDQTGEQTADQQNQSPTVSEINDNETTGSSAGDSAAPQTGAKSKAVTGSVLLIAFASAVVFRKNR